VICPLRPRSRCPSISCVVRQKFVEQIVAGTREGAGPTAEAKSGVPTKPASWGGKEGVALGGAHLKMRNDDGPGPLTRASAAGATLCRPIPDSRH